MSYRGYEAVIGLEIHAQLKTKSKMFSQDSTQFEAADNEHTSTVSMGMPGALPVVNAAAIRMSALTGLALNCTVQQRSVFARKNYFYPDLPKGYQISQYDKPICTEGYVEFMLDGEKRRVRIERAHMEEDAGKSNHFGSYTLINLNRSGIPLLEIVSGPDMRSPREAAEYARMVRQILRYLDVCDGNLEEGSLRCDCNISVMKEGAKQFGTKVEIKNINSFRFAEKALEYEIDRQIDAIEAGEKIVQETRLYDPDKNRTFTMRTKEEAHDYRYFPDPDLLPVVLPDDFVDQMKSDLPELPLARAERFQDELGLPEYDALVLTQEKEVADYFEKTASESKNPKAASNWIMTELLRQLNENKLEITQSPIAPESLAQMIRMIDDNIISGKMAKTVFAEMWKGESDPEKIVKEKGLVQITDSSQIESIVDDVIAKNSGQVEQYRSGKTKLFGFFVGQVMKASKGQANPDMVNQLLKSKLDG